MFTDRTVRVEQLSGTTWRLLAAIVYDGFRVPPGYVTDFASVPKAMSWLIPKSGEYNAAAILHDWLITDQLPTGSITSVEVDKTFREAMKALGVPFARLWLMWAGVRLGAIGNPKRRAGSLRTLLPVLLVCLLALPVVLPGGLGVLLSTLVLKLLDLIS